MRLAHLLKYIVLIPIVCSTVFAQVKNPQKISTSNSEFTENYLVYVNYLMNTSKSLNDLSDQMLVDKQVKKELKDYLKNHNISGDVPLPQFQIKEQKIEFQYENLSASIDLSLIPTGLITVNSKKIKLEKNMQIHQLLQLVEKSFEKKTNTSFFWKEIIPEAHAQVVQLVVAGARAVLSNSTVKYALSFLLSMVSYDGYNSYTNACSAAELGAIDHCPTRKLASTIISIMKKNSGIKKYVCKNNRLDELQIKRADDPPEIYDVKVTRPLPVPGLLKKMQSYTPIVDTDGLIGIVNVKFDYQATKQEKSIDSTTGKESLDTVMASKKAECIYKYNDSYYVEKTVKISGECAKIIDHVDKVILVPFMELDRCCESECYREVLNYMNNLERNEGASKPIHGVDSN